ncbi:conjugal transfer protein [Renibacterium salmoninarum ATCC 33209]|uniref:Conjugal transfer protein n=1 Tax=Renibacterium salmoninarum (strain ATCC 33209 / DSM 20767 / JCM 11484 / NBRC 15589 / NCIMB 2235) TaxID=288705 RepID=A9WP80_RENSM|nr:conjugal transfer protein [Renibacterium salmoninarum ATCC 33209]
MRDRENPAELFETLHGRGNIVLHPDEEAAFAAIAADAARSVRAGESVAVAAATNEQAKTLNEAIQAEMAATGRTRVAKYEVAGMDKIRLRHGDVIQVRKNDADLGVANRELYEVAKVRSDGSVNVREAGNSKAQNKRLPAEYVNENTHLGYASTVYGVQGTTVAHGSVYAGNGMDAAAAYVGLTRGRQANTLHMVATDAQDAQKQFVQMMATDRADRGLEKAGIAVEREIAGLDLYSSGQQHLPDQAAVAPEETIREQRREAEWARYYAEKEKYDQHKERCEASGLRSAGRWLDDLEAARARIYAAREELQQTIKTLQETSRAEALAEYEAAILPVREAKAHAEQAGVFSRKKAAAAFETAKKDFRTEIGEAVPVPLDEKTVRHVAERYAEQNTPIPRFLKEHPEVVEAEANIVELEKAEQGQTEAREYYSLGEEPKKP